MSIDALSELLRDPVLSSHADQEAQRLSHEASAEAREQIQALNAAAQNTVREELRQRIAQIRDPREGA
jgi:hypothetical protein